MSQRPDPASITFLTELGIPEEGLTDPADFARRLQEADRSPDHELSPEESDALGRLWIALDKEVDEAWRRREAKRTERKSRD